MKKRAFITGIAGQDGSYLAELLLSKGYDVSGLVRNETKESPRNLIGIRNELNLVFGDISDEKLLHRIVSELAPDEIYNLASVSSVISPWHDPVGVSEVTALPPVKILEIIRNTNPAIKFFQPSSAEMFGNPKESPQSERTPFLPHNPYGIAKLFAHTMVEQYRDAHGIFACSGIIFNHESPRRADHFVTQKIVKTLRRIARGENAILELGNLDSKRDWGFAGDYVEAMWLMLQANKPDDYVIATGESHTVREFVETTAALLNMEISWEGTGLRETGKDVKGKIVVGINEKFYRPFDIVARLGDIGKIQSALGWFPKTDFRGLVEMMVKSQ